MFVAAAAGLSAMVVGALLLGLRAGLPNRLQGPAGIVVLSIPAMSAGVYLVVGNPAFIAPHDSRDRADATLRILERQVAAHPELSGPLMNLAQALEDADRYLEAGAVWQRAAALEDGVRVEALQRAALALIAGNGNRVSDEVTDLIADLLALEPGNVFGRFYTGLEELQSGRPDAALATWTELLAELPLDAESRPMIEAGIEEAAARVGSRSGPPGPAAPVPDDSQIRAMVDGLAARLAEHPDDPDGWKRLGRSRRVLDQFTLSYEAYMQAVALVPEDTEALAGAAESLALASGNPADPPAGAVALFRRVLALDPDHLLALYVVGEEAARRQDTATAETLLGRLLRQLPTDDPMHRTIAGRLEQIGRK